MSIEESIERLGRVGQRELILSVGLNQAFTNGMEVTQLNHRLGFFILLSHCCQGVK
jgi:hypothetical protein